MWIPKSQLILKYPKLVTCWYSWVQHNQPRQLCYENTVLHSMLPLHADSLESQTEPKSQPLRWIAYVRYLVSISFVKMWGRKDLRTRFKNLVSSTFTPMQYKNPIFFFFLRECVKKEKNRVKIRNSKVSTN